jgi:hypothetical protein
MAPSDSQSGGAGQAPAVDPSSQVTTLSVDDVQKIIAQAQAGATDPVTVGMQIFTSLGDNVTVTGDVLRQALAAADVPVAGSLSTLVAASQSIAKSGSQVTVTNSQQIQTEINGTQIRFDSLVTFNVGTDGGFPTISGIEGAAAHKIFWIGITEIQLQVNQGVKTLHVVTSAGSRDFPLS